MKIFEHQILKVNHTKEGGREGIVEACNNAELLFLHQEVTI